MSSSDQITETWISAFCSLVGHEYFAEVSEDFIEDDFNLTGLQSQVPMYKEALEMILDVEPEESEDESELEDEEEEDQSISELGSDASMRDRAYAGGRGGGRHARMASDISVIESSAEMLYGLIHQRFITSRPGMQQMLEKYEMGHFGTCPRVHCKGAKVLPVGCSDIPGHETVKLFCPACLDVYGPPNSRFQSVDGAFFGTTFGCLFFMTFPELDIGGTKALENGKAVQSSDPNLPDGKSPPTAASTQRHRTYQVDVEININGVSAHNLAPGLGIGNIYEPRIYGFRVSELARIGPRMRWLRMKPDLIDELDEVEIWTNDRDTYVARSGETGPLDAGAKDAEGDEEEDMDLQEEEEGVGRLEEAEKDGRKEVLGLAADAEARKKKKGRQKGAVNGGASVDEGGASVR